MSRIGRGIVITTHTSTKPFLLDLVESLSGVKYPYIIIDNTPKVNEYEMGGIKLGRDIFEEFVYLQDTIYVKKLELFDMLFDNQASISPNRNMYNGYYNSNILDGMVLPIVTKKTDAVLYESVFCEQYIKESGLNVCLFPEFVDGENYEYKYGRNNKIIENDFLKKYKGTWSPSMIVD